MKIKYEGIDREFLDEIKKNNGYYAGGTVFWNEPTDDKRDRHKLIKEIDELGSDYYYYNFGKSGDDIIALPKDSNIEIINSKNKPYKKMDIKEIKENVFEHYKHERKKYEDIYGENYSKSLKREYGKCPDGYAYV